MKTFLLGAALAVALPSVALAAEMPEKPCCCCKDKTDKNCCRDKAEGGDHAGHDGQH